ncbi:MAG TPA: hypothetical protein PKA10_13320 [Selenomonadales bacterium]|nr:hypothetical protein [Selenomonadales bacterium]
MATLLFHMFVTPFLVMAAMVAVLILQAAGRVASRVKEALLESE